MVTVEMLYGAAVDRAAGVVAREQAQARLHRPGLPAAYTDPEQCRVLLDELIADGYVGFVAHDDRRCVGVMCGRTTDSVGFVPAHGLAVDPDLVDSTAVVVRLFAQLAPVLLHAGASRFTIDHVDIDPRSTMPASAVGACSPASPLGPPNRQATWRCASVPPATSTRSPC